MPESKFISAEQAAYTIKDKQTIITGGFVGVGFAEAIAKAIEQRYLDQQQPRQLTLLYAAGQGDGQQRGLNHLAHQGLVKRVIGGHWGLVPKLGALAVANKIEAYNLPQGVICHMFRDMAAKRPATLSQVGLHTFIDPRQSGGQLNSCTQEPLVELVTINGSESLNYRHIYPDVAILRGTTADIKGNVSMEREALPLDALAIAQAVKNNSGTVIVQVERVTEQHQLSADRIVLPGVLVDHLVISQAAEHPQTFSEQYNPNYTGETKSCTKPKSIALDPRKVIARRAAMFLKPGAVVNLGIGMPEKVASIAAEEDLLESVTLTVEPGGIGGLPASGLSFGAVNNAEAIIDQPAQFDFYDGGGLDQAFLGLAQTCAQGHVNVSRFGDKIAGAGGFINICHNTPELYFLGSFTAGKQQIDIVDGKLSITANGPVNKFLNQVEQITFNGQFALSRRQKVTFITERAVFKLTEQGLTLTEIAPGVDLERDILALMAFEPVIDEQLKLMDERLFQPRKMFLDLPGSRPINQLREAMPELPLSPPAQKVMKAIA